MPDRASSIGPHGDDLISTNGFIPTNVPRWNLREELGTCSLGDNHLTSSLVGETFWTCRYTGHLSATQRGEDEEDKQPHAQAAMAQL